MADESRHVLTSVSYRNGPVLIVAGQSITSTNTCLRCGAGKHLSAYPTSNLPQINLQPSVLWEKWSTSKSWRRPAGRKTGGLSSLPAHPQTSPVSRLSCIIPRVGYTNSGYQFRRHCFPRERYRHLLSIHKPCNAFLVAEI